MPRVFHMARNLGRARIRDFSRHDFPFFGNFRNFTLRIANPVGALWNNGKRHLPCCIILDSDLDPILDICARLGFSW